MSMLRLGPIILSGNQKIIYFFNQRVSLVTISPVYSKMLFTNISTVVVVPLFLKGVVHRWFKDHAVMLMMVSAGGIGNVKEGSSFEKAPFFFEISRHLTKCFFLSHKYPVTDPAKIAEVDNNQNHLHYICNNIYILTCRFRYKCCSQKRWFTSTINEQMSFLLSGAHPNVHVLAGIIHM